MSKHKEKLKKLFEHPISGNIDSGKLVHALEHYGAEIDMSKKGRAKLILCLFHTEMSFQKIR